MTAPEHAWDRLYVTRGRLYGGSPQPLPMLPGGSQVLEIGCGDGKGLSTMLGQAWRVTAVDTAPGAIRLCLGLKGRENAEGFLIADATQLPFRPVSFDAVFCAHILGHLDMPGRVAGAAEACRVLHAGGSLFFREFSTRDMRAGAGQEIEPGTRLRGDGIMTHYFTVDEARELFFPLIPDQCEMEEWHVRIHGRQYRRSEVVAVFHKGLDASPDDAREKVRREEP